MSVKQSLFAKIRSACSRSVDPSVPRPARLASVECVLRRFRSADAGAKHQAWSLAEGSPLRPEGRARNQGDANDQRAPVRDKAGRELFGLTPEKATEARRHGAISYVSADQRERVAKAAITREEKKVIADIKKLRASGETVPSNSPDKRRHGSRIRSLNTPSAVTAPSGGASSRANTFPMANGNGSSTTRAD